MPAADVTRITDVDRIIAILARKHPHVEGAGRLARLIERQRIASAIRAERDCLDYCLFTLDDAQGNPACGLLASVPTARGEAKFAGAGPGAMFFGFLFGFDTADRFAAVMRAAVAFGRERGRSLMVGPFETTINYSSGLLAEEPAFPLGVLLPRNPLEWNRWLEDFGFACAERLRTYEIDMENMQFRQIGSRLAEKMGLGLHELKVPYSREEKAAIRDVFNSGWEDNWGFVPLDDAWVDGMMQEFRPLLWPGLQFLVYKGDTPVGVLLATPDFEELFRGRPGPLELARRLWRFFVRRQVRAVRVFILGVSAQNHGSAAAAVVAEMMLEEGRKAMKRYGARYLLVGWTLESNHRINRMIRHWAPEAPCVQHRLWSLPLVQA